MESTGSLAQAFLTTASWRREKAEQYPEDERNDQSAEALESLAEYVEPDGQYEAGSVVDRLTPHLHEGGLGGEGTQRAISRYGYGYRATSQGQHEEFLDELVALCLMDLYEEVGDGGDDWAGVLLPAEIEAARKGVHLSRRYFELRSNSTEHELVEVIDEELRAQVEV